METRATKCAPLNKSQEMRSESEGIGTINTGTLLANRNSL